MYLILNPRLRGEIKAQSKQSRLHLDGGGGGEGGRDSSGHEFFKINLLSFYY